MHDRMLKSTGWNKPRFCRVRLAPWTLAGLLLGMSACKSTPEARMFALDGRPATVESRRGDPGAGVARVAVLPVRLPAYLDRPQIVTRPAPHELHAGEFNRWGMPLDQAVAARLTSDLSAALPDMYVFTAFTGRARAADRSVAVDVVMLDGRLGGEVQLVAQWSLHGPDTAAEPLLQSTVSYRAPADGAGYDAYVAALAQVVGRLGDTVADGIRASY